jgi:hypothetical protein
MEMDKVRVYYRAFDPFGTETIRLNKKPSVVFLDDKPLEELKGESGQGFSWTPMKSGGLLTVKRLSGHKIVIASE